MSNREARVDVHAIAHHVPSGNKHLEHVCTLCREQPMLRPLAVEALLHAPLAVLVDPDAAMLGRSSALVTTGRASAQPCQARALRDAPGDGPLPLRQVRNVDAGIPQFSAVLFSDMAHFHEFMPDAQRHCFLPECGDDILMQLAEQGIPLVIDPGARHALYLAAEEHRPWQAACGRDVATADFGKVVSVSAESAPSPLLLDRLSALLVGLEAVERVYLCRTYPRVEACDSGPSSDGSLTLLIQCPDQTVVDRVCRALPLLGWDLPASDAPSKVLSMLDCRTPEPDVAALLTPVYDAAMGAWLHRYWA
jgi:hypothetical protein